MTKFAQFYIEMDTGIPTKKLIIIGDGSVGKTAMLLNFVDDIKAGLTNSTIGVDFKSKIIEVNNQKIKLQIWDTAGQERFRNIAISYYRRSDGIALVYDVSSQLSFDHIPKWMDSIAKNVTNTIPTILIGNKIDLDNKISLEQGQNMASEYNVPFFQTSAKTGEGINEAFTKLAEMVLQNQSESEDNSIKIEEDTEGTQNTDNSKCHC